MPSRGKLPTPTPRSASLASSAAGNIGVCGRLQRTSAFLRLSVAFSSGVVGGVCNALMAILLYVTHIQGAMGVTWDPLPYHPVWLYNKMVWGGFWGFLHSIPYSKRGLGWFLLRGVCFGLLASTLHCAVVFPAQDGGMFAVNYGKLTWIVVYVTDGCWAIGSSLWYYFVVRRVFDEPAKASLSALSMARTPTDAADYVLMDGVSKATDYSQFYSA